MSHLPTEIADAIGTIHEYSDPDRLPRNPCVTVYMAVYNHGPYLQQAIEGVIAQEGVSVELLIGEDNSIDESLELAIWNQREQPELIRVLTGNRNIGARLNFCRAMARARGRFIAFCEGDDWWIDRYKLQRQVALLEADDDVGLVHSNYLVAYPLGGQWKIVRRRWRFKPPADAADLSDRLFSKIFRAFPLRTCTAIYRAEVIRQFLISPLLSVDVAAGDRALAGYCAAHWDIRYLDLPTAVYRVAPGSATRMGNQANIEMYRGIVRLYERFRRIYGNRPDFDHSFARICYPVLAIKAARVDDIDEFDRCIDEMRKSTGQGIWRVVDYGIRMLAKWPLALSVSVWVWDLKVRVLDRLYLLAVQYLGFGTVDVELPPAVSGSRKPGRR